MLSTLANAGITIQRILSPLIPIAELAPIATTIIAIWVAFKQSKIHRNSYKPYCDICCIDYNKKIIIKIKNNGMGVMTISSFEVCDKNNNIVYNNLYSCISEDIYLTCYSVDIINKSIAPNNELIIIKKIFPEDIEHIDEYKKLRRQLKQFAIRIKYVDMYGKEYLAEKDLSLIYGEKRRLSPEEYATKHREENTNEDK